MVDEVASFLKPNYQIICPLEATMLIIRPDFCLVSLIFDCNLDDFVSVNLSPNSWDTAPDIC